MVDMATALCANYGVTIPSDILSPVNGTATNGTASTSSKPAPTTTDAPATTSNGAARMAGSGFVAAAMGAALFVL